MLVGVGCGANINDTFMARRLFIAECGASDESASLNVAVLDWTGGTSPIYPDDHFRGVDLAEFPTADGGTLADDDENFKELVRLEVTRIFCEWPDVDLFVLNGEDHLTPADTIVHLTQELPAKGRMDIGEGEYDPCNRQNDNAAIIFGERLSQLGGAYSFDEWVRVFANVCAHEIGHTLGYGHIEREEQPDAERSLYVELMLVRHTMSEMRREQRFVVEQTNCPDGSASSRRRAVGEIMPCTVIRTTEKD